MPRRPTHKTDAFQAAVAEQVEEKLKTLLPELAALLKGDAPAAAASSPGAAAPRDMEGLALAIARLGTQGVGREQIVDPAVIEGRRDAQKRMAKLLIHANEERQKAGAAGDHALAEQWMPFYRLTQPVYLDEILIPPVTKPSAPGLPATPTEIGWPLVPNHAMIPLNEIAKHIHAEFMASVGNRNAVQAIEGVTSIGEDLTALAITAGGHVIRGGAGRMSKVVDVIGDATPPVGGSGQGGLKVRGRGAAPAPQLTRVLGTVAEPAMS